MYDGINTDAATIRQAFPDAQMVAYYVNGRYAWSAAEIALFPHANHVTITITASADAGDVLDVEQGDATPAQTEGWIARRKASGLVRPTIYCSLSAVRAVRQGAGKYVLGKDWDLWVADYDDTTASVYPLAAAKQYRNTAGYDVTAVYDDGWPHRTPVRVTPPPPAAPVWPAGVVLKEGGSGGAVRVLQAALRDTGLRGVRGITVDGTFGSQTLTAVKNFQQPMHLAVDGIAGKLTRTALGIH
jgi:putative peptidoglycan binding protein